jgi:DNA-directed RNA polymerase specialized sigma24 family protein
VQVVDQRVRTEEDFAALCARFLPSVWDLAVRIIRDREEAAAAAARIFARAREEFARPEPENARSWVYGLAAAELRSSKSKVGSDASLLSRLDPARLATPEVLERAPSTGQAVWAAAASLPVADYLLLDLQARRGLDDAELGRALRLDSKTVERKSARIRGRLEEAVWAPIPSAALFAALAPVPLPAKLEADILAGRRDGRFAKRSAPRRHPDWKIVIAALLLGLLMTGAGAAAFLLTRGPAPKNPTDVHSSTHQPGSETSDPNIEIVWTPAAGARGYSVSWSDDPETPDTQVDLAGSAKGTTAHLAPGSSWFNLRTEGEGGRWSKTLHLGPFLIIADTTPPDTRVTAGPSHFGQDTATFRFRASEDDATLECSLDRRPFAACASPWTVTYLRNGRHTLRVRAEDLAGNVDGSPDKVRWIADSKAPNTTVRDAPDHVSKTQGPFVFAATERAARFQCSLDRQHFARCTSPQTYAALEDGRHRFRVRAIDRAGNVDRSAAVVRWKLDTKAPDTRIVSGPAHVSRESTATFAISSEAHATFECRLDDGSWSDCISATGLKEGRHIMRARAKDKAGNVDRTPARWRWRVALLPETRIRSGPSGPVSSTSATFRFNSDDPDFTFQCRLDMQIWKTCASPQRFVSLSQGDHRFRVRARDAHGNLDPSPAARTWTVDTIAPKTTISSGPNASTASPSATFRFTASENAHFQCRLDGGVWRACSSPKSYSGLKNGAHVFRVRALDPAGNVDASPANRTWTVH